MSKKDKNEKPIEVYTEEEFEADDEEESSAELKKKAKEAKKREKKAELEENDEILNSKSKTRAGQNFKMYKFIIKIVIFAVLIAFAIVLWVEQATMVGAVFLVSGIGITFTSIIRMVPLLKTSKSNRARLILFVQCIIHLVIGAYLILAAFIHWNVLNGLMEDGVKKAELLNYLQNLHAGNFELGFAKFNLVFYIYLMVGFFFTLSAGYFWVTIRYNEKTTKTLFWLMMISNTLAVVLGLIAKYLDARTLIITLIVLICIGALVVGGEAGGGYYRYRKTLTKEKKIDKKAEKEDGKNAPAREEEDDEYYSDIDPAIIPMDEPGDEANIPS